MRKLIVFILAAFLLLAQNPNVPLSQNALGTVGYWLNSSSGTAINKIVAFTGAPSKVVTITAGSSSGAVGIVANGPGTTGTATVQVSGSSVPCVFDGSTTAGDYVQISASVNGDCTDAGSSLPTTGQIIGIVTTTNSGVGTYKIDMVSNLTASGTSGTVTNVTGTAPVQVATGTTTPVVSVNGLASITGPLKANGSSAVTEAASSDIVNLFTGCSGTQYLGADGACHAVSAGGSSVAVAVSSNTATQTLTHNLGTANHAVSCVDSNGVAMGSVNLSSGQSTSIANMNSLALGTNSDVIGFTGTPTGGTCTFISGSGTQGPTGPSGPSVTFTYNGIPVPSAVFVESSYVISSTGNTDLYQCVGLCIVGPMYLSNNGSGGSIVWYPEIKHSGTYYPLSLITTSTTNNNYGSIPASQVVLSAGDYISVNTATTAGGVVQVPIVDSSVTGNALKTSCVYGTASGANTLYTVTTGKTAMIMPFTQPFVQTSTNEPAVYGFNDASGTHTFTFNYTPNGGSAFQLGTATSTTASTRIAPANLIGSTGWTMAAGDSISVTPSANNAAQFVCIVVAER